MILVLAFALFITTYHVVGAIVCYKCEHTECNKTLGVVRCDDDSCSTWKYTMEYPPMKDLVVSKGCGFDKPPEWDLPHKFERKEQDLCYTDKCNKK